jgi:hypothetical protein
MWLILLDVSGSMADPFSGAISHGGKTRETDTEIKIEAAREALLLHLRSLGQATDIAILTFNNIATLIFQGLSTEQARIEVALAGVVPGGDTDIAAALRAAAAALDAAADNIWARILLISDGLSSPAEAAAAAAELHKRRISIDAVLIDPTDAGSALIRDVIKSAGMVTDVTSRAGMKMAVSDAQGFVRAELAAVQAVDTALRSAISDAKPVWEAATEEASFTVASPAELAQNSWADLLVYVHLASLTDQVRAEALSLGRAKGSDILSPERVTTRLPRGAELLLTPKLSGFDINPKAVAFTWAEDIGRTDFRIRPSRAPPGPAIGEVEIAFRGIPVARIPISIEILPIKGPRQGDVEPKLSTGKVFDSVFASYARGDLPIVQACAAVYAACGIYLIIDKEALLGGQAWRGAIKLLILKADAFHLFWSMASSVSPNVSEEILDALTVQGDRGPGFIRPTYWEEPPPALPENLKHLNFAHLDLNLLRINNTTGSSEPIPAERDLPLPGGAQIPVAVLPLLPGSSASSNREIAEDVAYAVGFIEHTLAARYYPVPTLLVDRYTVRAVRMVETIDAGQYFQNRQQQLADLGELLSAICLDFHVRKFWEGFRFKVASMTAEALGEEALATLIRFCEGQPGTWFIPSWIRSDPINDLKDCVTLREAAYKVTAAAQESAHSDESAVIRFRGNAIEVAWPVWRSGLEPLGLAVTGRFYDTSLIGPVASFKKGLNFLWTKIAPVLDHYIDRLGERAPMPDGIASALALASSICSALLNDSYDPFGGKLSFVEDEIDSERGWQAIHQQLLNAGLPGLQPSQSFVEFGDAFFGAVIAILRARGTETDDQSFTSGFAIKQEIWNRLAATDIPATLQAAPDGPPSFKLAPSSRDDGEKVVMNGPVDAFADGLEWGWTRAKKLLLSTAPPAYQAVSDNVPTYGIFAPAQAAQVDAQLSEKAREWGVPNALTLPASSRVLLCSDALDDFRSELARTGTKPYLARLFLRRILVHEHFHAYVATAPDDAGHPPVGPGFRREWDEASPVNEALAAWMEVHMARDNPELACIVSDYLALGQYPRWPYAGAAAIEAAFNSSGPEAVRSLVRTLRKDPPAAMGWMQREMTAQHAAKNTII